MPLLLQPDSDCDRDGNEPEREQDCEERQRELDPVLEAHSRRGQNRHQRAVRWRDQLGQSRAVLIREHLRLSRNRQQVPAIQTVSAMARNDAEAGRRSLRQLGDVLGDEHLERIDRTERRSDRGRYVSAAATRMQPTSRTSG